MKDRDDLLIAIFIFPFVTWNLHDLNRPRKDIGRYSAPGLDMPRYPPIDVMTHEKTIAFRKTIVYEIFLKQLPSIHPEIDDFRMEHSALSGQE
jgi:hypothetical protein